MYSFFDFSPGEAVDLGATNGIFFLRRSGAASEPQPQPGNFLVSMSWPQSRRSEATINGHRVHIAPACHQLLQLLLFSDPRRSVPLQELVEAMWPNAATQPLTAETVVRVYVRQLRKLGIAIEGRSGLGYRIPPESRGRRERLGEKLRHAA